MITEKQSRKLDMCPGCGKPKVIGLVVCWDCMKYRKDITPLKYFDGTFEQWQVMCCAALLISVMPKY